MGYIHKIAICKNEDCRSPIDLGIAVKAETSGDVVMWGMLGAIDLICPRCGILRTYTDDDFESEIRNHPPEMQPLITVL